MTAEYNPNRDKNGRENPSYLMKIMSFSESFSLVKGKRTAASLTPRRLFMRYQEIKKINSNDARGPLLTVNTSCIRRREA